MGLKIINYTKQDIEKLQSLSKKIENNLALLEDYHEYNNLLKRFGLDGEEALKEFGYPNISIYVWAREKKDESKASLQTEGKVLGAYLGLADAILVGIAAVESLKPQKKTEQDVEKSEEEAVEFVDYGPPD